MKGGGQQGQSGTGSMDILWIAAFFVLLFAYIWYAHYDTVIEIIYAIKYFELEVAIKVLNAVQSLGVVDVSSLQQDVLRVYQELTTLSAGKHSLKQVGAIAEDVSRFFRYPFAATGGLYAAYILFFSGSNNLKSVFTMSKLREQEKERWPYIRCVDKNLIKKDLDSGPWAMSMQPLQLVLDMNLVEQEPVYGMVKLTVKDKDAFDYFSRQMGGFWTGGIDCLPGYARALFAIFAAKGNGDDAGARALIDQIAISSASGSLNYNGSLSLLRKHISSKGVGRAVSPHAYILTAMASMLEFARTGGVLAMAEIIWLKKIDRRMWYMLQSVGRQTPFIEASGPFAHWIVEKRLRRPLKVPMVNEAVQGLIAAIRDIKYNPDGY